ncbi:MAG: hypothetical protein M3065_13980 [Actinomycetota bacterium]|nr:hypothetical protein [Actinomycetota bacterium]
MHAEGRTSLLLEEYRTLRDEAKQCVSERMTLLGFLTASAAFIIAGTAWLRSWRALDKLSRRLAELESQINELAHRAYRLEAPSLLVWENRLRKHRAELASDPRWWVSRWGRLLQPPEG